MSTVLQVPDDGPWFAGHFPGRPILPGIAVLALVAQALALGPIRRIAHARFRSTLAPGETLTLDAKPGEGGAVRVTLRRADATVMNAELVVGVPEAGPSVASGLPRRCDAPPLDDLLPHRPPMRFVTAVLAQRDDGAECAACVPADCALVESGSAPALAVIEAAAQAAAVWEALRRARSADAPGPRLGYLVSLRDVTLHRARVPAGVPLRAAVRLEAVALPLTHYAAEVSLEGETVLRGGLSTVLADERPATPRFADPRS
jgi:predicted hotdog family 3-hydroxylacyl-ACP dehydratase